MRCSRLSVTALKTKKTHKSYHPWYFFLEQYSCVTGVSCRQQGRGKYSFVFERPYLRGKGLWCCSGDCSRRPWSESHVLAQTQLHKVRVDSSHRWRGLRQEEDNQIPLTWQHMSLPVSVCWASMPLSPVFLLAVFILQKRFYFMNTRSKSLLQLSRKPKSNAM